LEEKARRARGDPPPAVEDDDEEDEYDARLRGMKKGRR
jgi:hypothetical protein